MKIIDGDFRILYVPFNDPFVWAAGSRPGMTRVFVALHTREGLVGYGESISLLPFIPTVLEKTVMPLVLGTDPHDVELLYRRVEGMGYYHHKRAFVMAFAAVEMAMWDLIGKAAEVPLYSLLGGRFRREVETLAYLHMGEPAVIAEQAADYVSKGWRTIKLKLGAGLAEDLALVRAVREAVGPNINIRADPNGGWTPAMARRQLAALEPYGLQFIEQPLMHDDLIGHAELRRTSQTAICIDEGVYTNTDMLNVIRAAAADAVLVDIHEAGGLWQARKQAAIAEAAGMAVGHHSGGDLGVSTAAVLHLAAATPNMIAIDWTNGWLVGDVITEPFVNSCGSVAPPEGPGLGVDIDMAALESFTVSEVHAESYGDAARPDWFTMKPGYNISV
jgi:L-rhamnonate dehydratase